MKQETKRNYINMLEAAARAGAESAREALSSLLDRDIVLSGISVESRSIVNLPETIGGSDTEVVAILMELTEEMPGNILLVIYFDRAEEFARELTASEVNLAEMDEMTMSALGETGNIMLNSFLTATAELTGQSLFPLPPLVSKGPCAAVMDYIMIRYDEFGSDCVLMKIGYSDRDQGIHTHILFFPLPETAEKLAAAAGSRAENGVA
jgi:chemotaxis protein CheC